MYLKLLHFLSGAVQFELDGVGLEETLNRAQECGIPLWEIVTPSSGKSPSVGGRLQGNTTPNGYKLLARIAKRYGARSNIQQKQGVVFLLNRGRRRPGILAGMALFIGLLLFSQQFIWAIEIHHYDDSESDQAYLLEVMAEKGITPGRYAKGIDFLTIQQEILTEIEEISWMSLNKRGTVLEVEVSEKTMPPLVKEKTASNVVAKTAGKIRRIDTYKGVEMVAPHEVVYPGELLVSGVIVNEEGEVTYEHADAKVIAQTEREHTISFDLTQQELIQTEQVKTRRSFYLLGFTIPLFVAFPFDQPHEREVTTSRLTIGKTEFAIGFDVAHYTFFETVEKSYSQEEAEKMIEAEFLRYEKEELTREDLTILRVEDTLSLDDSPSNEGSPSLGKGSIAITRRYLCEEDIAQKQAFYIENPLPQE